MNLLRRAEPIGSPARGGTARTIARRSGKALLGLVLVLALLAGVGNAGIPGRTSWSGTRSAASTPSSTPRGTQSRSRASCLVESSHPQQFTRYHQVCFVRSIFRTGGPRRGVHVERVDIVEVWRPSRVQDLLIVLAWVLNLAWMIWLAIVARRPQDLEPATPGSDGASRRDA
jgi:hypothetical protein